MEKKVYTIEKFIDTITAPINDVKRQLVLAGNNLMNLNSKSEIELRQMILDYVTIDTKEVPRLFAVSSGKFIKLLTFLGLSQEEFFKKIGYEGKIDFKDDSTLKENEAEQYLFHTEELFEQAVIEFLTSKSLSNQERVVRYMDRVNDIDQQYRKLTRTTPGFVGSERWKEAQEFLRTIPRVELYKQDEKVGDYINIARAKGYYDDIARQLEGGWGIGGNGNNPKSL